MLSTLAVKPLSFAITPFAPATAIAWGNCKKPYSVYMASSLVSKKACAIIDINSSEPLPNIILSLLSEYLFPIALIKSSLTCGGYLCKFVEKDFTALNGLF